MSEFLREHTRSLATGEAPDLNQVWCNFLLDCAPWERHSIFKRELELFDRWKKGDLSFLDVIYESEVI